MGVSGSAVTYLGPTDELDPSNAYEVPADGDRPAVKFRKGVLVSDVPKAVVDVLKSDAAEGHEFAFGAQATKAVDAEPPSEGAAS